MTPVLTFFIGLAILVLFGWYFASESDRLRRILGTVLTIVVTAFCLWSTYPPFDEKRPDGTVIHRGKIHLGLDLQGGTSFLIRLEPPASADGGTFARQKEGRSRRQPCFASGCRIRSGRMGSHTQIRC